MDGRSFTLILVAMFVIGVVAALALTLDLEPERTTIERVLPDDRFPR